MSIDLEARLTSAFHTHFAYGPLQDVAVSDFVRTLAREDPDLKKLVAVVITHGQLGVDAIMRMVNVQNVVLLSGRLIGIGVKGNDEYQDVLVGPHVDTMRYEDFVEMLL